MFRGSSLDPKKLNILRGNGSFHSCYEGQDKIPRILIFQGYIVNFSLVMKFTVYGTIVFNTYNILDTWLLRTAPRSQVRT